MDYTNALTANSMHALSASRADMTTARTTGRTSPEAIRGKAEDFEAVFFTQMLQQMYAGIEVDENFGGGHAEETWRSLLMDEYGKVIVKAGGVGIADQVERELLTLQEVPHAQ